MKLENQGTSNFGKGLPSKSTEYRLDLILQGNCLEWLKQINDETVDCCVTSPPYYALRDYKTEGQLGLEKTFQEYLDKLVEIFSEVKRVLKKSGTCWVVMGDTYTGHKWLKNPGYNDKEGYEYAQEAIGKNKQYWLKSEIVPEKSLCMIPSRFAISMIDAGWILRNDIIWYKPNCMPSSAKDRFTVDYEHIFFFTKDKKYYFKTQYEPQTDWFAKNSHYRKGTAGHQIKLKHHIGGFLDPPNPLGRIKRTVWKIPPKAFPEAHFAVFPEELVRQCLDAGCPPFGRVLDPFSGAGTTYKVALQTGRKAIGIELNPQYIEITKKRITPYIEQRRLEKWN